jgi:hypothetical protein
LLRRKMNHRFLTGKHLLCKIKNGVIQLNECKIWWKAKRDSSAGIISTLFSKNPNLQVNSILHIIPTLTRWNQSSHHILTPLLASMSLLLKSLVTQGSSTLLTRNRILIVWTYHLRGHIRNKNKSSSVSLWITLS